MTAYITHAGNVKTDMWAEIRDQALFLEPEGEALRQWVDSVEETAGGLPWEGG